MKDPKPLLSSAAMSCNLHYFESLIQKHKEEIKKVQMDSINLIDKRFDHAEYRKIHGKSVESGHKRL